MEKLNYWLIEMNPEVWDVSKAEIGDCQTLDSRNKAGALKPLLGDMKVGELILVYEAAVNKCISRVLVVTAAREMVCEDVYRDLVFKVVAEVPAVTLDELKEKNEALAKRIQSPAAIHKLCADEFHSVMKIAYSK